MYRAYGIYRFPVIINKDPRIPLEAKPDFLQFNQQVLSSMVSSVTRKAIPSMETNFHAQFNGTPGWGGMEW